MPLRLVGVSSIATVNWSTWIAAGGAVAKLALAVAAFWALKQNSVALAATRRDTKEAIKSRIDARAPRISVNLLQIGPTTCIRTFR
jgi:hypothetical protein